MYKGKYRIKMVNLTKSQVNKIWVYNFLMALITLILVYKIEWLIKIRTIYIVLSVIALIFSVWNIIRFNLE